MQVYSVKAGVEGQQNSLYSAPFSHLSRALEQAHARLWPNPACARSIRKPRSSPLVDIHTISQLER